MKKTILMLTAGLALAGPAGAEQYTLHYTARIATINGDNPMGPKLDSTIVKGHVVTLGDTVTGDFTFDSADPPFFQYEYDNLASAMYGRNRATTSVVRFDHSTLNDTGSGNASVVTVEDSSDARYQYDGLLFTSTTTDSAHDYSVNVGLYFSDRTARALEGVRIPTTLPPQMSGVFHYRYSHPVDNVYQDVVIRGEFTSVVISAVPEPGTGAMMLAGLGVLCWRWRRRGRGSY